MTKASPITSHPSYFNVGAYDARRAANGGKWVGFAWVKTVSLGARGATSSSSSHPPSPPRRQRVNACLYGFGPCQGKSGSPASAIEFNWCRRIWHRARLRRHHATTERAHSVYAAKKNIAAQQ